MNKLVLCFIIFLGLLAPVFFVSAASGTIDSTYKYAWSNQLGWINFGCSNCNVQITDSAITGYAWSVNHGWINLNPTTSGITNTTSGVLSGYAWGENTGWINFSGVTINTSTGEFSGTASGDIAGTINFNSSTCTNCKVVTDWRSVLTTISGTAIAGVTAPSEGATPVTTVTQTSEYTGTVVWSGNPVTFAAATVYTATITLTAKSGYTFTGVSANQFTVSGAFSATNSADSGVVSAEFPSTGGGSGCIGSHNECNIQTHQCVSVPTCGNNQCSNDDNCAVHNECNTQTHQCVSVSGTEADTCTNNDICAVHNECNAQKQCVEVAGADSSSCAIGTDDCNKTYGKCDGTNIICRENGCTGMTCVIFNGNANSECTTDAQCTGQVHKACNAQHQCVLVDGGEDSSCSDDSNCQLPPGPTHNDCDNGQCIIVTGLGDNKCINDAQCVHNECDDKNQCVQKAEIGISQCQIGILCLGPVHNECNSQKQCISASGKGPDICQVDSDCEYHRECDSSNQCVSVSGAGPDRCGTAGDCGIAGRDMHNECNSQKQCVLVNGSGSDRCQTDSNCTESVPAQIIKSITEAIAKQIPESIVAATKEIKKIIETPQGSIITKTISTTGFVVTTIAVASPLFTFSFFEIFLIPLRLLGLLLTAFGLKKRIVPWGVVYDSVTKRPLDPAYVVLKNLEGKEVSSAITDLDGRYGFLVEPGVYQIQARKTNYNFPSQKLANKTHDELHADLYFGENIIINKLGEVIIKNIPLDPVKFDWNEFAKKGKNLMKFYSKWDVVLRKFYDCSFIIGLFIAIIAFLFAPYPYNSIIVLLYLFLLLLRVIGLKPKTYGYIVDKITGIPLSFAIVRVMIPGSGVSSGAADREITSKSADKYGKYYCLVPPGRYYVNIDKKNDDGSYSFVYSSPAINVSHKGIIKEKFKV